MEAVDILHDSFSRGITRNLEFRKSQLKSLFKMLEDHETDFCEALQKDLSKPPFESKLTELLLCKHEIAHLLKNMDNWLANEKVSTTFLTLSDSVYIQRQPFGVALCIGTWNYPIQLSLLPLAGLLAAGNCVILKPSEVAVHTQNLIYDLLPKYLDQNVCRVLLGDAKQTSEILKHKFDYIFYTGSANIGKLIMEAAAKHLTPVTLELGGKSPTYLDKDVELKMAVKRILWAKFLNSGQTCLAPDYLLCHKDIKESFIHAASSILEEFYTTDPSTSPDYTHIINERHYNRLMDMIKHTNGKVLTGGNGKEDIFYIAPTLIELTSSEDVLMESEIFGPILPIITVDSDEEAITFINSRDKPLAIYVFCNKKSILKKFEIETTSGGLLFNDCMMHIGVDGLPFGGIGNSGMGYYHGRFSIEQFSHKRAILDKDTKEIVNNLFRYPPFNKKKEEWAACGLQSNASANPKNCSIL